MAEDPLQILGKQYMQLVEHPYEFTVEKGNGKKSEVFQVGIAKRDIVHATGLSHISSYGGFGDKSISVRESIAQNLANGVHAIADLQAIPEFTNGIFQTYNSATGKRCTIEERVLKVGPIIDLLENGKCSISIYEQKNNLIPLPRNAPDARNHSDRTSKNQTDYIISIPYGKNPNRDERIYLFAHKEGGRDKQTGAIKLFIHSAIADCVDFTQGQQKVGSVVLTKVLTLSERKNVISQREIYIQPEYEKRIKISGKVEQLGMARAEGGSGDHYFAVRDELIELLDTKKACTLAATLLEKQKRAAPDDLDLKDTIEDELDEISKKVADIEGAKGVGNIGMNFSVSPSGTIAVQQVVSPVQAIREFVAVTKFKIECAIRSILPMKEHDRKEEQKQEQAPSEHTVLESFEQEVQEQKPSREEMLKAIREMQAELEPVQSSPAKEETIQETKAPVQQKANTHTTHRIQEEFAR